MSAFHNRHQYVECIDKYAHAYIEGVQDDHGVHMGPRGGGMIRDVEGDIP